MRILWFIGRIRKKDKSYYGGGGWIRSLSAELVKLEGVHLAQSFFIDENLEPYEENGVVYYPMHLKSKGKLHKLYDYWALNPEYQEVYLLDLMNRVITDFKPDIIQIFGTESMFTSLIGKTSIPTVLYMQGVLNPISNSYYPYSMNASTILFWRFDKREWLFRNGLIYREKQLKQLAANEKDVFKRVRYIIGRTSFDYQVSRLISSESLYFKVNEMMRAPFYEGRVWERPHHKEYRIFSTLSNVTYKGFDVVLKTASLLAERGVSFRWRIAGLSPYDNTVDLFEHHTGVKSSTVNVEYLGVLDVNNLKKELLNSNVFVHPSYIDNSPNSVGEAQLLGLPVIGCYVGGVPDMISPGETGELIPANDPFGLAYLLIKDIEVPFLHKYSLPAYEVASKRHDKTTILSTIMGVYKEIVRNNSI